VKKLLFLGIVVAGVIMALHWVNRGAEEKNAEVRVRTMMEGWLADATGTSGDAQTAICMWFNGKRFPPDRDTLALASTDFDSWRRKKGLLRKIHSYTIESVELIDEKARAVRVKVKIDGRDYVMKLQALQPIEWVE